LLSLFVLRLRITVPRYSFDRCEPSKKIIPLFNPTPLPHNHVIRSYVAVAPRSAYPESIQMKEIAPPSGRHVARRLTSHDDYTFGSTGPHALKRSQAATVHEWLSSPFSALCPRPTMDCYKLTFTVPSPATSATFMEFSPNGRFLAVGDQDLCSLYILDRLAGLHPTISAVTPTEPTALVWENSKELYVGLGDGRFIHYQIDLRGNRLVRGATNNTFHGGLPATAIALDAESRTLILSVGPEVFAFRRIRATSLFYLLTN